MSDGVAEGLNRTGGDEQIEIVAGKLDATTSVDAAGQPAIKVDQASHGGTPKLFWSEFLRLRVSDVSIPAVLGAGFSDSERMSHLNEKSF